MGVLKVLETSREAIEIVNEAPENYRKIVKMFNKYCRPTIRVLVVGESGTGKSQFLLTICKKKEFVSDSTMISYPCQLELPNGRMVEFIDTPGQQSLKPERKRSIKDIIRKKYSGIINLVCYGYQVTEETDASLVFQGDVIKESYLKENREKELKQLEEWLPEIDKDSNVKWVLTIINKADVWWEKRDEVIYYYKNTKYGEKLKELLKVSITDVLPYCSVINPFCHKPMKLIFGEKEKYTLHCHLCSELKNLTDQEWPK